ncbi:MAG TPA: helical backbone metal receptor [Candidatus Binatus sp.]|nr:helical backbone metal receptor [Candidatus Binatus sp.]
MHINRVLAPAVFVILLLRLPALLADDRSLVDDLGFTVRVKTDVRRVVSLVPTNSEMVCLLDCQRLKGGTRYDKFPLELRRRIQLRQIEIIGGGFDANLEKIVQLQPDLILTNGPTQQRFAVPLKNLGYTVVSLWPRDMDGLIKDFLLLGELLGQEQKAHGFISDVQQRFQTVAAKANNNPKKKVYLQMWTEPLITVGRTSFPHWLVSAAGGVNVFGDLSFDSGQIGLESLIQRDPEVLIFLAEQAPFVKTLARRPGWSSIRGVRAGHFCFIEESDIRRSIMFIDGLMKLRNCLFGDAVTAFRSLTEPN